MKAWIPKDVYWDANGKQYFQPDTWADFHAQLTSLYIPKYAGYPQVGMFQFAGDRILDMIPHKVDYDLIDDDAVYQYLFCDGPRPAYLDAAPDPVKPPVTVAYIVSNSLGTFIQPNPKWGEAAVLYVKNGTALQVDPAQSTATWVRVTSPAVGWCAANRVKAVTK
jgi:hypothetical protein